MTKGEAERPEEHARSAEGSLGVGRVGRSLGWCAGWCWGVGALVAGVMAVRLALHLRYELSPGVDAGYYPLLSRRILETGSVMVGDLPLRFVIDAALARVLLALREGLGVVPDWGIDEAVVLAAKVWDSVLPPLAAVPIVAWVMSVARGRSGAGRAALAAVAIGIASFPIVRMLGDFQKNALGLVWFAGLVYASLGVARACVGGAGSSAGTRTLPWRGVLVMGVMLMLVAATHVGASAACAVYVAMLVLVLIVGRGGWSVRRVVIAAGAMLAVGVPALGVMYVLDSKRAIGLFWAPWKVLRGGGDGPGLGDPVSIVLFALSVWAAWATWRVRESAAGAGEQREPLDPALRDEGAWAATFACVATALVLSFPLLSGAFSGRLSLMAPMPLAFVAGMVLVRRGGPGSAGAGNSMLRGDRVAMGICGLTLLSGAAALPGAARAMVDDEALLELRSLRASVTNPSRTLLAAPHGVEFWAGFVLRVDVRHTAVPAGAFDVYDEVLLLRPVRGVALPGGGPRGRERGRPAGPRGAGGGDGGGDGGPGGALEVPAGETPLFKGDHFTLYRLMRPAGVAGGEGGARGEGANGPGAE